MSDRRQHEPSPDPAPGPLIGALTDEIERLRRVVDASIDLWFALDGDGAILDVSAAVPRLLGRSRRDVVGSSIDTLLHPDDVLVVREARRRLLSGVETAPERFRFRFRAADGTARWVEQLTASVTDADVLGLGAVASRRRREVTMVLRDVTEQAAAEAEAARADERLRDAIRATEVGTAICDATGGIGQVDEGFSRLLRAPSTELLGRPLDSLLVPVPDAGLPHRPGSVLPAEPVAVRVERELRRPDGSTFVAELNVRAVGGAGDEIGSYVVLLRDLTERDVVRSFEGSVGRHHRNELLGRVTTGAAEHWAHCVEGLRAQVDDALDDELLAPSTRRRLEAIVRDLEAAAGSARELQLFAGHRAPVTREVDLCSLVERTIPLVERASDERVELVVELGGEGCVVTGDPQELESVLLALVLNAVTACVSTDVGRPRTGGTGDASGSAAGSAGLVVVDVRARTRGDAPAGPPELPRGFDDWVLLRVTDDGPGMDEAVRRRAFEPFFSTRPDGSGLGLAVVDRVARDAGGVVRLRSEPGRGTSVELWLPAASSGAGAGAAEEPPPATLDIVVVDDQPEVLDLASRVLERAGHRVRRADGADVALRLIGDGPLDVLVSDLVMPGMSGQQLVAQLRRSRPDLGVVVITGYAGDSDQVLPDDIELVTKPFRSAELIEAVGRAAPPLAATSS